MRAERHLLDEASRHDAKRLKVLGKHLLHVIDPDAADEELARRIEAEEAAAARRTFVRLFDDGNGTCHGTFRIPSLHGAMLTVALEALASPKRPDLIRREEPVDPDDADAGFRARSSPEVLGEAFCQLLERFPVKKLPKAGGGLVTVLVTMELDRLLAGLGTATMSTGDYVSAGQVRRLACASGIIPAVLGSKSQLLDLGRKVGCTPSHSASRWPAGPGLHRGGVHRAGRLVRRPPPGAVVLRRPDVGARRTARLREAPPDDPPPRFRGRLPAGRQDPHQPQTPIGRPRPTQRAARHGSDARTREHWYRPSPVGLDCTTMSGVVLVRRARMTGQRLPRPRDSLRPHHLGTLS